MFQPIHQQLHTGSVSASAAGLESALLPRSKPKGKFITSSVSSLATASASRRSTGQRCGTGGRMSSLTAQSPPNFRYFQTFSVSWQFFFLLFFFSGRLSSESRKRQPLFILIWVTVQISQHTALYVHSETSPWAWCVTRSLSKICVRFHSSDVLMISCVGVYDESTKGFFFSL